MANTTRFASLNIIDASAITQLALFCEFNSDVDSVGDLETDGGGLFNLGCYFLDIFTGNSYKNDGTVGSPVLALVPDTGSGITELDGDVVAGPGVGTQTAEVQGLFSVPLNLAATVDASFYVFDSTPGGFNPVVMSGDTTMDNLGAVTIGTNKVTTPKINAHAVTGAKVATNLVMGPNAAGVDASGGAANVTGLTGIQSGDILICALDMTLGTIATSHFAPTANGAGTISQLNTDLSGSIIQFFFLSQQA
ncbi:MAG: hypothetical protein V4509_00700 [Patescibacteria group bacterium]